MISYYAKLNLFFKYLKDENYEIMNKNFSENEAIVTTHDYVISGNEVRKIRKNNFCLLFFYNYDKYNQNSNLRGTKKTEGDIIIEDFDEVN